MTSNSETLISWANPSHTAIVVTASGIDRSVTKRDPDWSYYSTHPEIEDYVVNVQLEQAIKSSETRKERDHLLVSSDWTQVADAPVDKAAWAAYRQALRDITSQAGFPDNVVWPVSPAEEAK